MKPLAYRKENDCHGAPYLSAKRCYDEEAAYAHLEAAAIGFDPRCVIGLPPNYP